MKVIAIIQARMGSTRLPGKVMKTILGLPILQRMMERLNDCKMLDEIVIATTDNINDAILCEFAKSRGYIFGVGSEDDVLGRYYKVAQERRADVVVRLTSDCPLIDPGITDLVVKRHVSSTTNDLTSNVFTRTFPRGFDTEVLSFSCLERVHKATRDPIYREHVTNYIHDYPELFKIENVSNSTDYSHFRLCVDTEEDLEVVKRVYQHLYEKNPKFRAQEIYDLLNSYPEIPQINAPVQQAKIFKRKDRT